jgi:hypothetical protein
MKHSTRNRNGMALAQGAESAHHEAPSRFAETVPVRSPVAGVTGTLPARPSTAPGPVVRVTDLKSLPRPGREQIERRAYELYLARGGRDGSPLQDWLRAERELTASGGPQA